MKKIYLSGPITGRPVDEYRMHFATVDASIRGKATSHAVEITTFNPTSLKLEGCKVPEWHDYMRACVAELVRCDGIAILDGWVKSRGARFEVSIADVLHIPIVYIETPVNELDLICLESINPEIYRYWVTLVGKWESHSVNETQATDRALIETANRFLDPYGFEYIKA
jgi:hypothetical protein